MDALNDEIKLFVNSYMDSLLSWDVIVYLYDNKFKVCNVGELAKHLGKPVEDVERVFQQLRNRGLIKCCADNKHKRYERSRNFQRQVEPFVVALNQRRQRLAILSEILERSY